VGLLACYCLRPHYLKTFDLDSDGIPENSAPDQTLTIGDQGVSAYCGGLWLAALEAAIAIGQTLMSYPSDHPLEILDSP